MSSASSKFYITTAIAYTNAPPHIGFALELCQADAIARYRRLAGDDVFFLTGTDEHGQKNAKAASNAGKTPREFVDEMADKFRALAAALNISNDYFIRTSDQEKHWPGAQRIWQLLAEHGKLYRKNYHGLYCGGCEAFKKPSDLKDGKCPDHNREPEIIEEENWFFKLSEYQDRLIRIIGNDELKIYPDSRKNEVLAFITQGLEDVSFSRPSEDIPWGIPVPNDPTQIMYVWCDALTNYLTGIGYGRLADWQISRSADSLKDDANLRVNQSADLQALFERFWPADLHIIGKDILRFHAIIWPAMLLAVSLPLPKSIFVHGHILSSGQKMSKSLGNVVDPFEVIEKYGADALRYFLLKEIPPTHDGDFTWERFRETYNADLANSLGNLMARTLTLGEKYGEQISPKENSQGERVDSAWETYRAAFDDYNFPAAIGAAFSLVNFANEYIDREKPWEYLIQSMVNGQRSKVSSILSDLVFLIGNAAWMLKPFLPDTADKILDQFGLSAEEQKGWQELALLLKKGPPLFPRSA